MQLNCHIVCDIFYDQARRAWPTKTQVFLYLTLVDSGKDKLPGMKPHYDGLLGGWHDVVEASLGRGPVFGDIGEILGTRSRPQR